MNKLTRINVVLAAALVVGAAPIFAQAAGGGAVARVTGGFGVSENHREIPAVAAKALVAAHHPEVIDGSLDPAIVTMLLDAGSNYVASSVAKAAVAVRDANGAITAAAGGFVTAGGAARASTSPAPTAAAAVAPAVATTATASTSESSAPRPSTMTIGGIGPIDASTVAEMFTTTYAAGEIGPGAVRVRFVILKAK